MKTAILDEYREKMKRQAEEMRAAISDFGSLLRPSFSDDSDIDISGQWHFYLIVSEGMLR